MRPFFRLGRACESGEMLLPPLTWTTPSDYARIPPSCEIHPDEINTLRPDLKILR